MVPIPALWLPILLSAVIVFVVSSIIHMMLPYHRNNVAQLPKEDEVAEALRRFDIPPGDYMLPRAGSPEAMRQPAFIEKMTKGPVLSMTVVKNGPPNMAPFLIQWFVYCILVGIFAAYLAGRALEPGAHYLQVFRFAGATAFIGYAVALWQDSIWYQRKWSTTIKFTVDGLLYGLLTGGTFGWLWPR